MITIKQDKKDGRINLIAFDKDKVVGWVKLWTWEEERFDWIIAVYIRPEYRGQGIFRMLMDAAKNSTPNDLALRVNPYKDQEGQDPTELFKKYQHVGFIHLPDKSIKNMYFIKKKRPQETTPEAGAPKTRLELDGL